MKTILEPAREIPVAQEVDVLVLGAGPAGLAAAVSAGREGARTLLVEQFGDVGGVSTVGLMSHWTGNTRGGLYWEILRRSHEAEVALAGGGAGADTKDPKSQTINPELLKGVYLDMLDEAGVETLLYTQAVRPLVERDTLGGVVVENKSGREAILARQVVDATGDGDIAARAGAPFFKGRESDGKMQPMTLMFKVAGVDTEKATILPSGFENNPEVPAGRIQDLARREIPFPAGHCLLYRSTMPGVITCNMTNAIDVDGTRAEDLTRAHILCRRQIPAIVRFLRAYVPGFERCWPVASASFIGIRETRHFEGEKTLTEQDILDARVFPDWAATFAHFNFDVHNLGGAGLDSTGCQAHFRQSRGYTIPYGALVPKRIDNLLLAGRNISGTHLAHSNFRVMPICVHTGQAAGIAAALCARDNLAPRALPVARLQEKLLAAGMLDPNGE